MTGEIDYAKLGLKCGIEIHQRLDTHKLFCECPGTLRDDKPDIVVKREMRAVAGETGEIDVAAAHEMGKDEYYVYEAYSDSTCLVELDEEPPHPMNEEALQTVLQVSKMLNAEIVDEVQVMRKTVVNGSNTSGFQRTALVAIDGWMDIGGKKIGVPTISIEEDAAKDISKGVDKYGRRYVVYRLDRLGTPLIEIGTDPDINTPEECKAAAEHIGMVLRSTGKVARGLGTIRQDVNVSIASGARIEIKGAQDLKMLPTLVDYEARRQKALVDIREELEKKGFSAIKSRSADVTDILKKTECKFVNKAIKEGAVALAFTLLGFAGLLGKETQPGKRLGTELSDYAKVKTGIGGMIHSDEKLDKYNFSYEEITGVKNKLTPVPEEAFVIIVTDKKTAERAMECVIERAGMCFAGVPREVRKANPDGTTTYMRPMPGAARMYPETDIRPIKVDASEIELPELLTEKKGRFVESLNLGKDLAQVVAKSGKAEVFEGFAEKYKNVKPAFIAETMFSTPKNLSRKHKVDISGLSDSDFEEIFSRLDAGKLIKDNVEEILLKLCKREKADYDDYAPLSDEELEKEIKDILDDSKGVEFKIIIGKVMGSLRGRAEGKRIMDMLKKLQ